MSPRKDGDQAFLNDIRKACALLLSKTTHMQLPDFVADTFFQHGVANLLLIIGEAAKNISPATRHRYLAGALGLVGIASIFKTGSGEKAKGYGQLNRFGR